MIALLLLLAGTADAACARRVPVPEWVAQMEAAEAAYAGLDVDGYGNAMDEAALVLPCLDAPVEPAQAARWHRLQGLRLFLARDRDRAVRAFGAARALDPGYTFPEVLIPAGHPARSDYATMDVSAPRDERVPEPFEGELRFDGTAGVMRPADRPTVAQRLDGGGTVAATAWLEPGEPLFPYEGRPVPAPRRFDPRFAVGAGAGAAAIGSGVLYLAAARDAARFDTYDANRSQGELDELRGRANGQVIASTALGALALAGVATLVVVW